MGWKIYVPSELFFLLLLMELSEWTWKCFYDASLKCGMLQQIEWITRMFHRRCWTNWNCSHKKVLKQLFNGRSRKRKGEISWLQVAQVAQVSQFRKKASSELNWMRDIHVISWKSSDMIASCFLFCCNIWLKMKI